MRYKHHICPKRYGLIISNGSNGGFFDEEIKFVFEQFLDRVDFIRGGAGAGFDAKKFRLQLGHARMIEIGQRREVAAAGGRVEQTRKPECLVAKALENLRPFPRLQRDAIRPVKPGGDESDAARCADGEHGSIHFPTS